MDTSDALLLVLIGGAFIVVVVQLIFLFTIWDAAREVATYFRRANFQNRLEDEDIDALLDEEETR